MNIGQLQKAEALLKVLANLFRLQVVLLLTQSELSVSAINQRVALGQSALSQHLAVLSHANVVTTRREGKSTIYALAHISQVKHVLAALGVSQ